MNWRTIIKTGLGLTATLAITTTLTLGCVTSFGQSPTGDDLSRIKQSPQYGEDSFVNPVKTRQGFNRSPWKMIKRMWNSPDPEPPGSIPVMQASKSSLATAPAEGLRFVWVNHATVLVEIDGFRVLTDPIWAKRCSPVGFAGPARYHKPGIAIKDLPKIDAVIISHDHYDHLDEETVHILSKRNIPFYVPLGVGSHFKRWGVTKVKELDWWQRVDIRDKNNRVLTLGPTPARHFSGRSITDRNKTLWASWIVIGPKHRVWFGGDTGYFDGFKEIGRRFGPFDLTIVPIGAYDVAWSDIHLNPEEAVQTHVDVKGQLMMPIHWGTFDLALHTWQEPVLRLLASAKKHNAQIVIPKPGQIITVKAPPKLEAWWLFKKVSKTIQAKYQQLITHPKQDKAG